MEKLLGAPYLKLNARVLGGNIVESAAARLPDAAAAAAESVVAETSLSNAAAPKPADATGRVTQTRAAASRPGQAGSVDPALAKGVAKTLGKAVEGALVIAPLAVQSTPEDTHREAVGMVLGMGALRLAMAYPYVAVAVLGSVVTFYQGAAIGENAQRTMNEVAGNADPSRQEPYQRARPKGLLEMFGF
jgi:hypothetical protein